MDDLIRLTDNDREILKEASEKLGDIGEAYLAGRLAGLSGRIPHAMEEAIKQEQEAELK